MFRKNQRKGGIKAHTLYDIKTSVPTFFHVMEAMVHDTKAMDEIPYEKALSTPSTEATMTSNGATPLRVSDHTSWSAERRTTISVL